MKHKVGWHLGNARAMKSADWGVLEAVPPVAVTFITGEAIGAGEIKRILDISHQCHFFFRPYFAPSDKVMDYHNYLEAVASLIDTPAWDFIPEAQRHLQMFNEPNMPKHSQWEGFGSKEVDMHRFTDWWVKGYERLKRVNPTWKIGFTPLTPGNRDVWFAGDLEGVPYYMHGPEAAKAEATRDEIEAAIRSGPCYDALKMADEYLAHIYVMNDVPNQVYEFWSGMRFAQYAKFLPKPMDIWITECGIGGAASNWALWYEALDLFANVKGTCIWRLGYEIRSVGDPAVKALKQYVEGLPVEPVPEPPEPPTEEPEEFDIEERIRNRAWNVRGVPYNPEAALARYARQRGLGAPLTAEVDLVLGHLAFRVQGFVGGIVFAEVGRWEETRHIVW